MRQRGIWMMILGGLHTTLQAAPLSLTQAEVKEGLLYIDELSPHIRYPVVYDSSEELTLYERCPSQAITLPNRRQTISLELHSPFEPLATGMADIFEKLTPAQRAERRTSSPFQTSLTLFYLDQKNFLRSREISRMTPDHFQYVTRIDAAEFHLKEPWCYEGFNGMAEEILWRRRGEDGQLEEVNTPFPKGSQILADMLTCSYHHFSQESRIIFPFDSSFPRERQWSTLSWGLSGPRVTFPHVTQTFQLLFCKKNSHTRIYAMPHLHTEEELSWGATCPVSYLPQGNVTRLPCHPPTSLNMKELARSVIGGSVGAGVASVFGGVTAGVLGAATGLLVSKQLAIPLTSGITPEKKAQEIYLAEALCAWKSAKPSQDPNANDIPMTEFLLQSGEDKHTDQETITLY